MGHDKESMAKLALDRASLAKTATVEDLLKWPARALSNEDGTVVFVLEKTRKNGVKVWYPLLPLRREIGDTVAERKAAVRKFMDEQSRKAVEHYSKEYAGSTPDKGPTVAPFGGNPETWELPPWQIEGQNQGAIKLAAMILAPRCAGGEKEAAERIVRNICCE